MCGDGCWPDMLSWLLLLLLLRRRMLLRVAVLRCLTALRGCADEGWVCQRLGQKHGRQRGT